MATVIRITLGEYDMQEEHVSRVFEDKGQAERFTNEMNARLRSIDRVACYEFRMPPMGQRETFIEQLRRFDVPEEKIAALIELVGHDPFWTKRLSQAVNMGASGTRTTQHPQSRSSGGHHDQDSTSTQHAQVRRVDLPGLHARRGDRRRCAAHSL